MVNQAKSSLYNQNIDLPDDEAMEYYSLIEKECLAEFEDYDAVIQSITFHGFVSKSKGKNRKRKKWKEVYLVKYRDGFHSWDKFPFDVYATEIIGQHADGEDLKQRILDRHNRIKRAFNDY